MSNSALRLRLAREAAGVSLSEMARRTHYGKGFLSNVETGRRTATPAVVLAYERALAEDAAAWKPLTGLADAVLTPQVVSRLITDGFTTALAEQVSVDEWTNRVDAIDLNYMFMGPAELRDIVARQLLMVQQRLELEHMWGLAARMLVAYGKTTTNRKQAIHWYRLAAAASDQSADPGIRVWVRGRAAKALAYEGAELSTAEMLAAEAFGISEKPTVGRLNAMVASAHVAALRGDAPAALSLLRDSCRVFDLVGSEEQLSDASVPEWRFHVCNSLLLSRLGHPAATEEQDWADRTRPEVLPRFGTHVELHRALAISKSGDPASGLEYGRRALRNLPEERRSLSLTRMMSEVQAAGSLSDPR